MSRERRMNSSAISALLDHRTLGSGSRPTSPLSAARRLCHDIGTLVLPRYRRIYRRLSCAVNNCRFFDDGGILVYTCEDHRVVVEESSNILNNTHTPILEMNLKSAQAQITDMDFAATSNGGLIALVSFRPALTLIKCHGGTRPIDSSTRSNSVNSTLSHDVGDGDSDLRGVRVCPILLRPSSVPLSRQASNCCARPLCVKFATANPADGSRLLLGTADADTTLLVYDVEQSIPLHRNSYHGCDINTVTMLSNDTASNVVAGDDEGLISVWDLRCLSGDSKPQGALTGHSEGISCLDSASNGWSIVSNSKDQSMKIWDVRKMSSTVLADRPPCIRSRFPCWDYRYGVYPGARVFNTCRKHDSSLASWPSVGPILSTLIRCRYSSLATRESFIVSGSSCGTAHIYCARTGTLINSLSGHNDVVREVSWHPKEPLLVTSSWDGTIAAWSYQKRQYQGIEDEGEQKQAQAIQ